jgi:hypothetical protein
MKKSTTFVVAVALVAIAGIVVSWVRRDSPAPRIAGGKQPSRRFLKVDKQASGEVDLLKLIDPSQDSVVGVWLSESGSLISPLVHDYTRLEIPCGPPEEYDLELVIERLGAPESFVIGLVGAGRQFTTHLDAKLFGSNSKVLSACCSGLRLIDGRADNETVRREPVLKPAGSSEVRCCVRKTGVSVLVNGMQIIDWKGSLSRLTLPRQWTVPNKGALFLGTYDCSYKISRAVLKPV